MKHSTGKLVVYRGGNFTKIGTLEFPAYVKKNHYLEGPYGIAGMNSNQSEDHSYTMEQAEANADRLVDCWNGCDGLNPDYFPRAIAWLTKNERSLFNFLSGRDGEFSDDLRELKELIHSSKDTT